MAQSRMVFMSTQPRPGAPPRRSHPRRAWLVATLIVAVLGGAALAWLAAPRSDEAPPAHVDPPPGPPWFRAATAEGGLDSTYHNGEEAGHLTILETLGGGVALLDYDGDGLLDVFFP